MIDYSILYESNLFYEQAGFKRIESPWTVTKEISNITKPENAIDYEIIGKNKVLVASGEQSFLYLYLKGFIPLGKYQTITPCFRDEIFDYLHTKYFMKNELIITDKVDKQNLMFVINEAKKFFAPYLNIKEEELITLDTTIDSNFPSYDILYKNVELGSYGIRSCKFLKWIYGTGVAEPRFSNLIKEIKNGLS